LRYLVSLQRKTVSLGNIIANSAIKSLQPPSDAWISTDGGSDSDRWTIGGLYVAATNFSAPMLPVSLWGVLGMSYTFPKLSNQVLQIAPSNDSASIYKPPRRQTCSSNWGNPTTFILSALNELAFCVSIMTVDVEFRNTTKPPAPQVLEMQNTSTVNVFNSEYRHLLGSSLLSAVFVLLVASTFWAWWEVGRSAMLKPDRDREGI